MDSRDRRPFFKVGPGDAMYPGMHKDSVIDRWKSGLAAQFQREQVRGGSMDAHVQHFQYVRDWAGSVEQNARNSFARSNFQGMDGHVKAKADYESKMSFANNYDNWLAGAVNSDARFAKAEWGAGGYRNFQKMSSSEHFYRAGKFAFGSGANVENIMNSMGILTKRQMTAAAGSKFMTFMNKATPVGALAGITMSNGAVDYITGFAMPGAAAMTGWRVGKSLAAGVATKAGMKGVSLVAATALGGATMAIGSYAAAAGVGELINSASKSDNIIRRAAGSLRSLDMEMDVMQNNSTLTHRQQALNKLSKSALNNRGQLLGNEANIIAGLI